MFKRRLHRLFCVYTRQNATLCCGSIYDILASSRCVRYAGYMHISKKRKNSDKYHQSSFSCMQCALSCSSSLKSFFNFMQTHERGDTTRQLFCVLSLLSCARATACYPSLKTTTTTCGLIVGFFDLKHVREPLPCPFVCC